MICKTKVQNAGYVVSFILISFFFNWKLCTCCLKSELFSSINIKTAFKPIIKSIFIIILQYLNKYFLNTTAGRYSSYASQH